MIYQKLIPILLLIFSSEVGYSQISTTAIQAMVDKGGLVKIPPGEYTIDRVRITKPGTVIDGYGQVTLRMVDQGTWHMLLVNQGVHGVTFRGLHLDGNEANQPIDAYSATIRTTLSDNITVEDCTFTAGGDRAIDIRGGSNIRVTHCTFTDCGINNPDGNGGNAISIDKHGTIRSSNVIVTVNTFENVGDCAVGVPACDYGTVSNNVIRGNPDDGMNTESGISLNGSTYITCTGNVVMDQAAGGIFAWDRQDEPCIGLTIVGNTLRNANLTCRYWQPESRNVTIIGNTLEDSYLVLTGDAGRQTNIVGNVLDGRGIVMAGHGNKNHFITSNTIVAHPAIEIRPTVLPGKVQENLSIQESIK